MQPRAGELREVRLSRRYKHLGYVQGFNYVIVQLMRMYEDEEVR